MNISCNINSNSTDSRSSGISCNNNNNEESQGEGPQLGSAPTHWSTLQIKIAQELRSLGKSASASYQMQQGSSRGGARIGQGSSRGGVCIAVSSLPQQTQYCKMKADCEHRARVNPHPKNAFICGCYSGVYPHLSQNGCPAHTRNSAVACMSNDANFRPHSLTRK